MTKVKRTVTLKVEGVGSEKIINKNMNATIEEGEIPQLEDGEIPPSPTPSLEEGEIPEEEVRASQTNLPTSPMDTSTPLKPRRTPNMDPNEKVGRWIENGIGTNRGHTLSAELIQTLFRCGIFRTNTC